MEEPNETQKEVGRKYRDNLGYFKTPSFFAREKFYLCALVLMLGIYAILQLEVSRSDKVYNPAPLSISHANLEGNCAACHDLAARNIFRPAHRGDSPVSRDPASGQSIFFSSSASINQACQKCHANMDLHQPTTQTLALKDFHTQLRIVAATGCFNCHQEHLGRIDLKLPGDSACATCHNDARQMSADVISLALSGAGASRNAIHGMTSDGVVHFIPPERKRPLPLFTAFERGHPPFEYEQPGLKDPDVLTFSHRQHLVPSMKLNCADCHKPAADGIYYQRVTYQTACQRCHLLQLDPSNPELLLPHGDVGRLRSFLHSLVYQYSELDRKKQAAQNKVPSPDEQKAFAAKQIISLLQRAGVQSPGDFEHEILFAANPYKDRPPTGRQPFFPGCAYCHQVTQSPGSGDPVVTPPSMADRWLAHGAFTHAKHVSMSCVACHAANNSREASDLIMPAKESCATCHRSQGVAPFRCLACHTFHSPQMVVKIIRQNWNLPQTADHPRMEPLASFLLSSHWQ
jgi:hypothetical protein